MGADIIEEAPVPEIIAARASLGNSSVSDLPANKIWFKKV
jgi:hypothetical protein